MRKTREDIAAILALVKYKSWDFSLMPKGDGFLLQALFVAPCERTGLDCIQHCRKWYVSPFACKSEIVCTAFKAVQAAEDHELRERFLYRGRAIFNPHVDVDVLGDLPCDARLNTCASAKPD